MTTTKGFASRWLASIALVVSQVALAQAEPGLQLNQFFYRDGDAIEAFFEAPEEAGGGARGVAAYQFGPAVMLISQDQHDVEILAYANGEATISQATSRPVTVAIGTAEPRDGQLQLRRGEKFFAYLFWKNADRPKASVAFGANWTDGANVRIEPRLGREVQSRPDDRSGVIAGDAGVIEIAADHFIYQPRSEREQRRLLQAVRGEIVRAPNSQGIVAVRMDPQAVFPGAASSILALMGARERVTASSERVAAMYGAVLALQLQGFRVAVDPALQWHAPAFATSDDSQDYLGVGNNLALSMLPGMRESWMFAWLFDFDNERINVGIVDQGFAPNYDFRGLSTNHIWQCDFADHEPSDPSACAFAGPTGPAAAPQAVGNSFFGGRTWHGTGVVTAAVGMVNNGYGGVGSGGQVGVPMLYRTDLRTYALQFSDTIREASTDGAAIINISAGYPCRIFKVEAAPYDICNAAGRAHLIHDLWASAVTLAGVVCGPAAPICLGLGEFYASDFVDIIVEGGATDLREILTAAVAEANARGVVVVASAGNVMTGDVVCAVIDCGNHDTDAYQLIPCVTPGVLCVGAVGGDPATYRNLQFKGNSVDIWAPTNHSYFAPPDDNVLTPVASQVTRCCINATSGAAPVVAGVIALVEAAQPGLRPANPQLSAAERAAIPERIRVLLDATALRVADPADPALQLKIIRPYALIQAAADTRYVNPEQFSGADWFEDPSGASAGGCGADEGPGTPAVALALGGACGGSIVSISRSPGPPGTSAGGTQREDVDVTGWHVPDDGRYRTTITVSTPKRSAFGYVGIDGALGSPAGVYPDGSEAYLYETLPHFASQVVPITLRGVQSSDNLYRLAVGSGEKLAPIEADRFDVAATHPLHHANNDSDGVAAPVGVAAAPADPDGWSAIGTQGAKSIVLRGLTFHRPGDVDWVEIQDIPASAAQDCGSVLWLSAPDDIIVTLQYTLPSTSTPSLIDANRNLVSMMFGPSLPPGGRVSVAFKSASDAALEYDADVSFTPINPVICRWARKYSHRMVIAPLRERPIRWPLAARPFNQDRLPADVAGTVRPVLLFFDHVGGPLTIRGRLMQGASANVELFDVNGRSVWVREVGEREIDATAKGGVSIDAAVSDARPGTYFLLLNSSDPLAELEILPPSAR